jgi:HAMP domain-containing protein
MTEVGMNAYPIDPDKVAAYIREAHRMRAEATRELLLAAWAGIKGATAASGRLARSLSRQKFNLSVPAPHR